MMVHFSINLPYFVSLKQNKAKFAMLCFSKEIAGCGFYRKSQTKKPNTGIRQKDSPEGLIVAMGILWITQTRLYVFVLTRTRGSGLLKHSKLMDAYGT